MRAFTPFSGYNRVKAMYNKHDFAKTIPEVSALDVLCANEIQFIYLFVKWSGNGNSD